MRLVVTFNNRDDVLTMDVSDEMTLADLKAYIETEGPSLDGILIYNGKPMAGNENPLSHWGLQDDDMIMVVPSTDSSDQSSMQETSGQNGDLQRLYTDIERVRQQLLHDNVLRRGVEQKYPQLIEVIDDPGGFQQVMIKVEKERVEEEENRKRELKRLQDDPYNEESQRRILEMIQQEAIIDNLNTALEYSPEVFGTVTMLFVNVRVNGQKVKAFVDSGAQATIMTPECVERCNMTHLVDKRFQGVARGVGTAKIIGRIHSAPVKVGDNFLPCSFTVVGDKNIDMLLGLDMLKRHQGCIDLSRNILILGGEEIPFLPESEIPHSFGNTDTEQEGPTSTLPSSLATEPTPAPRGGSNQVASSSSFSSRSRAGNRIADAQPHPTISYSEETIQNLMNLGFSRQEVIQVLDQAGGNPELAAALLFQ